MALTGLTQVQGVAGRDIVYRDTLAGVTARKDLILGDTYIITDRADGVFEVASAIAYPPNGYSNVAVPGTNLVLRLVVYGCCIDLEQIGGKPLRWGTQQVDCRQALQEAFYLLLNEESATVDLKSEKWILSSYEFNDLKQRRKIRGDNAVIYGFAVTDDTVQRPYLISTAWNYQDIEGVTLDLQWNPNYACALRITHGYGRYTDITIRKSRCMIQVGIPDTNPFSLSEFMFDNLRGEENAKVAIVHGLYSVLNISNSIVPCGEGNFWKSYDCTGFTVYGGRVFLNKCGGNSNVINQDNPYVYLANSFVSGNPYIGSFSAVQCDFELRTRFCIVQDTTTVYQDYQQAVVLDSCRVGVYASLDARAKNFFSSTVGYRGLLRIKNTDVHFDTPLTAPPIVAGGHTLVDIDYDSVYIPGYRGHKMVQWNGYAPMMPSSTVFQSNIGGTVTVASGAIFVPFPNPIVDLSGDTAMCSQNYDALSRKFLTPANGLSSVQVHARLTLTAAVAAPVTVLIEANTGAGGISIARGTIQPGSTSINLTGWIADLPPNCQLYVITDSTGGYSFSNTGAYDSMLSVQAVSRSPKTRT